MNLISRLILPNTKLIYRIISKSRPSLLATCNLDQTYRFYSQLEPNLSNQDNTSSTSLVNPVTESVTKLTITQEFVQGLDQKLDSKNFKNLPYKQDEFNKIIYKIENPFNYFYFFEKYSHEFNNQNLFNFIHRLVHLLDKYSTKEEIVLPQPIKQLLTKQIIKHVPHYEPEDCFRLFILTCKLFKNLDDYASKSVMQLLKYHLNELDVDNLLSIKYRLDKMRKKPKSTDESPPIPIAPNEYVTNLERALALAVQIKYQYVKTGKQAVRLMRYFMDDFSDNNFEKLVNFVYHKLHHLEKPDIKDLLYVLEKKNYKHYKLMEKLNRQPKTEEVNKPDEPMSQTTEPAQ